MIVTVRKEKKADYERITEINNLSFGSSTEAEIVAQIRENCTTYLSLVAEVANEIVGHILFSPAYVRLDHKIIGGLGLGPMAVLPEFQNQGIGKKLMRDGIERIKTSGYPFVIVLGHAGYYPKFGFERASRHQLYCQWKNVPDESFMVMILNEEKMAEVKGVVYYRNEFNSSVENRVSHSL